MIELVDAEGNKRGDISYKTSLSAGFDIPILTDTVIFGGQTIPIPTNLFLKVRDELLFRIRSKYDPLIALQIVSRSGMAAKGIVVANSPGVVDIDFPGEIVVILHSNLSPGMPTILKAGDRVAQGVFCPVWRPSGISVDNVKRVGGLGSTGGN